jgi:hypothetical protein
LRFAAVAMNILLIIPFSPEARDCIRHYPPSLLARQQKSAYTLSRRSRPAHRITERARPGTLFDEKNWRRRGGLNPLSKIIPMPQL